MIRSKIVGCGSYTPEKILTNHDLEEMMDTSDEWIVKRTGIQKRRWAATDQGTSDLALIASKEAISNAKIQNDDIDLIIFATISPDADFPGSGCFLQHKLGLDTVPALDIRQQCSGFIYGLSIADMHIRSGQYKNILVVGAEIHSKGLNKTSEGRDISVLFGDGAGAAVVSACEVNDPKKDPHILSTHMFTQGKHAKELWMAAPGSGNNSDYRLTKEMMDEGMHYPAMNGKKVYVHAITRMCEVTMQSLNENNYSLDDVDLFLFHQANLRINEAVALKLNIPKEKVFNTIQDYANTTAATLPIGMNEAIKQGVLKKGMLVSLTAFGSGFTWGSTLLRF